MVSVYKNQIRCSSHVLLVLVQIWTYEDRLQVFFIRNKYIDFVSENYRHSPMDPKSPYSYLNVHETIHNPTRKLFRHKKAITN